MYEITLRFEAEAPETGEALYDAFLNEAPVTVELHDGRKAAFTLTYMNEREVNRS